MKNVISIQSVRGESFIIGKNSKGYYLRNKYTEIPNEFGMYDINDVEELFNGLCERIPESVKTLFPCGHPNSCMKVTYDDNTTAMYKQGETGLNLCAFTHHAAAFSEYYERSFFDGRSDLITLDYLRGVCSKGKASLETVYKAIKDYKEDDYTFLEKSRLLDGTISIDKKCYGVLSPGMVTIMPDGHIGNTYDIKFLELMKKQGVVVR